MVMFWADGLRGHHLFGNCHFCSTEETNVRLSFDGKAREEGG
jgi:hypothetical protein